MAAKERGEPQTHPQRVTPDPWASARAWLDASFLGLGEPDALVVCRMDVGDAFGPRYPVSEYHMQPGIQSRKGRPVIYEDPGYHCARTVATLRKHHRDAPVPDRLVADLMGISVRTIEDWRRRGPSVAGAPGARPRATP